MFEDSRRSQNINDLILKNQQKYFEAQKKLKIFTAIRKKNQNLNFEQVFTSQFSS